MKKELVLSAGGLAIAAVIGAAGAGTYSYFSDTASSPSQSVTSASLTLATGQSAGSKPIDAANLAPGDPSQTTTFTLTNTGSIPGALSLSVTNDSRTAGKLANDLLVEVSDSEGHHIGRASLSEVAATPNQYFGILSAQQSKNVTITIELP